MKPPAITIEGSLEPASALERRRHPRVGVTFMAVFRTPHGFYGCLVVDLSRGGAKLSFDETPLVMAGDPVTLLIEPFGEFRAETMWHRGEFAGIRFLDPPAKIAAAFHHVLAA
ncbi:MAG TPA: PilZ domain-containing protein [Stellaceae bacterium]|nr:PilZ domain-containing protein [Stellaceae bacterium]